MAENTLELLLTEDLTENKWRERVGKDVYLAHIQKIKKDLCVSRFKRGGEGRPFSLRFPSGECNQCWLISSSSAGFFLSQKRLLLDQLVAYNQTMIILVW